MINTDRREFSKKGNLENFFSKHFPATYIYSTQVNIELKDKIFKSTLANTLRPKTIELNLIV